MRNKLLRCAMFNRKVWEPFRLKKNLTKLLNLIFNETFHFITDGNSKESVQNEQIRKYEKVKNEKQKGSKNTNQKSSGANNKEKHNNKQQHNNKNRDQQLSSNNSEEYLGETDTWFIVLIHCHRILIGRWIRHRLGECFLLL